MPNPWKEYEVETEAMTYRRYIVKARSRMEAREKVDDGGGDCWEVWEHEEEVRRVYEA